MAEVKADDAKIKSIPIQGDSTISANSNPDESSTPSVIKTTGSATVTVKGSATILIKCEGKYTVSGSKSANITPDKKSRRDDIKKENYIITDGETIIAFDSLADIYVRGNATVTLTGKATFQKPSFIIKYVEFLKGGSGFTVVTSIGALNYLLVSAYGSGSYGDLMSENINSIVDFIFAFTIYLVTMAFVFSALMFFTETFGYSRKINSRAVLIKKLSKTSFGLAVAAISLAIIAILYHNGLAIALATIALFCFVSYITLDLVYDAINGYWRDIISMIAISVVAILLWANAYRDAEKAAFVADAEYCHWLKAPNEQRACDKFDSDPISYRAKLAN